jgi:phosphatidate cytidylyltransferase
VSELGRRVSVALVGAPIALGLIWLGDAWLATMVAVLAGAGAAEFYRIARAGGSTPIAPLGVGLAALLPLAVHAQVLGLIRIPPVAGVLLVIGVLALTIWLRGVDQRPLSAATSTVFGVLYTSATLVFAYALRYHSYAVGNTAGALAVIVPVVLTWASDTGAYFSGRLVGGRKLMPSVSPGKTVAGAIGALVTTVIVAWALMHYAFIPYAQLAFTPWGVVLFGVSISVAAQIGDLAESLLKREAGVKDSGTVFPGHGGVLDRLDSLYFVLPVAYLLYDLLLIPAPSAIGSITQ